MQSESENKSLSDLEGDGDVDQQSDDVELVEEMLPEKFSFFSDVSMFELAFGIASSGVNCLCVGMMLNIPTAKLHKLMYDIVPRGLLNTATTDQERISVSKAILDYWLDRTTKMSNKQRFKQLHAVFVTLREKEIANALKANFESNDSVNLEMFKKFDLGRLGPYVPPPDVEEVEDNQEEEEGQEEGDEGTEQQEEEND